MTTKEGDLSPNQSGEAMKNRLFNPKGSVEGSSASEDTSQKTMEFCSPPLPLDQPSFVNSDNTNEDYLHKMAL
jgi:hypothetical protein